MIRKLYLMNNEGIPYYFDYRSSTLITNIEGLGFEQGLSYLKYENMYECIEKVNPLSRIDANLIFLKGYTGYTKFLDYLKSSKDLRLYYEADTIKYCCIEINSLSKGEIVSGVLSCNIKLDKLSLWLKQSIYEIKVDLNSLGKVYPYKYPYSYTSSSGGKIKIKNNGAVNAPLKIDIYGEVINPEVKVLKDGILITSLKLYVEKVDCSITVDANPINQYMVLIEDDVTSNIYQYQDFSMDNFLFLNSGEYEIEFIPGVNSNTTCIITLTEGFLG